MDKYEFCDTINNVIKYKKNETNRANISPMCADCDIIRCQDCPIYQSFIATINM